MWSMERDVLGQTAILGKNLPQRYLVHHKSYIIDLESNQKNYVSSEALEMVACKIKKYSDTVLFKHNKTNISFL
jgi:hypothetical protein